MARPETGQPGEERRRQERGADEREAERRFGRDEGRGRGERGGALSAQSAEQEQERLEERKPENPPELTKHTWKGVLKRTVKEFQDDNLTDWAAALTYYGVLALFPAIIALVSIIGFVGQSATNALLENAAELAPGPAQDIVTGAINQVASGRGTAGLAFVLGIAGAVWSASGYVGAFARASNAVYEVEEGRPFWKLRPLQVAVTTVMILLLAASAIAVFLTGPVARQAGDLFGVGGTAVTVWGWAKWPVIALVVITMLSILYYAAPNVKQPKFRWITIGGLVALAVWVIASVAFAFYVANFGSYNKTYGTLGGVIAFLVWLWISNIAILFGAELNSEIERGRELQAGQPAEEHLQLPPRDATKLEARPEGEPQPQGSARTP